MNEVNPSSIAKRSKKTRPTIIPPPLPTSRAELRTLPSPTTPRANTLQSTSPATPFRKRSQTITTAASDLIPDFISHFLRLKRSTNSLRGDKKSPGVVSESFSPSTSSLKTPIKTMTQSTADDFIRRVEDLLPSEPEAPNSPTPSSRLYSLSSSSSSIFTREVRSPSPRRSFRDVSSTSTESTFDSEEVELTSPGASSSINFLHPQIRLDLGVPIASFSDLKRSIESNPIPFQPNQAALPHRARKSISSPSSSSQAVYSTALSPPPAPQTLIQPHRPRELLINSRRSFSHSVRSLGRIEGRIPVPQSSLLVGSRSMLNLSLEGEREELGKGEQIGLGDRMRVPVES